MHYAIGVDTGTIRAKSNDPIELRRLINSGKIFKKNEISESLFITSQKPTAKTIDYKPIKRSKNGTMKDGKIITTNRTVKLQTASGETQVYPSLTEAAHAAGVSISTASLCMSNQTTDRFGNSYIRLEKSL